jgi:Amt family ammonium transporter
VGFRVDADVEHAGIDEAEHAESGYDLSTLGSTGRGNTGFMASAALPRTTVRPGREDTIR